MRVEYSSRNIHIVMDDVGVFSEGFVSLGCIIKNHDKEVSMAPCRKEVVSVKPIVIEMLAIRWSLMLAPDLKLERILVQSYAIVAVDFINLFFENCCH